MLRAGPVAARASLLGLRFANALGGIAIARHAPDGALEVPGGRLLGWGTYVGEEAKLRAAIDAAQDAFVVVDEHSRVQDWNPAAERLFGWSREEILGKSLTDTIIPERFRRLHLEGMQRFLSTGQAPVTERRLEVPARTRSGGEVPVEISVAALSDGSGYAFSAFVRDLSERREAELGSARERAQGFSLPSGFWQGEAGS